MKIILYLKKNDSNNFYIFFLCHDKNDNSNSITVSRIKNKLEIKMI